MIGHAEWQLVCDVLNRRTASGERCLQVDALMGVLASAGIVVRETPRWRPPNPLDLAFWTVSCEPEFDEQAFLEETREYLQRWQSQQVQLAAVEAPAAMVNYELLGLDVFVRLNGPFLEIGAKGYGERGAEPGYGFPIIIEREPVVGFLRVGVFTDINSPEVQWLSLSLARECCRAPDDGT